MQAQIETTGIKRLIKSAFQGFGYDVVKLGRSKLAKPIDENYVEILDDPAFQASSQGGQRDHVVGHGSAGEFVDVMSGEQSVGIAD
jgi:hypothetical protein